MKKLALSLLLSTTLVVSNLAAETTTTNIGPLQLITTSGINNFAPGTVSLSGTINIGQSSDDSIKFQGVNLFVTEGNQALLMIDSTGAISAGNSSNPITFGNLTAAEVSNQTIALGISGSNYLGFTSDTNNVTLEANAIETSNLILSGINNITVSSSKITTEGNFLLGTDLNGNLMTTDNSTEANVGSLYSNNINGRLLHIGVEGANFLMVDSNYDNDIYLQANQSGATLYLSANGHINARSSGLSLGNGSNLLATDTNGNLITSSNNTYGSLNTLNTYTINASHIMHIGSSSQPNSSYCTIDTFADIDIHATAPNANLNLSATNNITVSSDLITHGTLLATDGGGNLISADSSTNGTFNSLSCQALTAGTGGSAIELGSPTSTLTVASGAIAAGSNNLLATDAAGHLTTSDNTVNATVGNLNAADQTITTQTISLGSSTLGTNNLLRFKNNSGNVNLEANVTGADLYLSANNNANLTGSTLNLTANNDVNLSATTLNLNINNVNSAYNVLAVDGSYNMVTSNTSSAFIMGDTENNSITVDNANTANGITLNTNALYLNDTALMPSSTSSTNVLTIDHTGKIGIVVSSGIHKDKIQNIKLDQSFDQLTPRSYCYKGNNHLEYGFIAEELASNEALKHAVIYEKDGITPMSVNYQTVFVALTADYLATKNKLKSELKANEEILASLMIKDETLTELMLKYKALEAAMIKANDYIETEKTLRAELKSNDQALAELTLKYELLEQAITTLMNLNNTK